MHTEVCSGLADDLEAWAEYEQGSHNRKQVTFSRGLRRRYRLAEEQSDEEIVETDLGSDDLIALPAETWSVIRLMRAVGVGVAWSRFESRQVAAPAAILFGQRWGRDASCRWHDELAQGGSGMAKTLKVKVNDKVTATRDYSPPGLLTPRRTLKAGTTCIVLEIHMGLVYVHRLSVRNTKTGEVFRRVPAEVFGR